MDDVHRVLYEVIAEFEQRHTPLSTTGVLDEVGQRLMAIHKRDDPKILTAWYNLFFTGVLSFGLNLSNKGVEWARLTEHGRATLKHLSRDPGNPDGYKHAIDAFVPVGTVARSYVDEALKTYAAGCDKATAVLIGAAAEALFLELRDELVSRMTALGKPVAVNIKDWRIKTAFEAVEAELEAYAHSKAPHGKAAMPKDLAELFTSQYPAIAGALRIARNEAGHPKEINPVTRGTVHANLLLFQEYARMLTDLRSWVRSDYS